MYKQIQNSLYKKYTDEIIPELKKVFNAKNHHTLPQIEKIVVNMGLSKAKDDKRILEEAIKDIASITGQHPSITRARKAISNFALREGSPIGCRVTLRGKCMYMFLERLLRIAIPRMRDFSGLKRSFDRFGNLSIGLNDESIFPEIDPDKIKTIKGMSITIVTDKQNRENP